MKKVALLFVIGTFATGVFLTACKKDTVNTPAKTLYDSLGGTTMVNDPAHAGVMIEQGRLGIRSVVDSTIFVIAADPAINDYFATLLAEVTAGNTSGFAALSKNLTDFVCVATGSKNYTYTGDSMADAHDPAKNPRMASKADNAAFDAFVVDLVAGAKKVGLSDMLIGQVGAVVGTLRTTVVQK